MTKAKNVTLQVEVPQGVYRLLKMVATRRRLGTKSYVKMCLFVALAGDIDGLYWQNRPRQTRFIVTLNKHWNEWADGNEAKFGIVSVRDPPTKKPKSKGGKA